MLCQQCVTNIHKAKELKTWYALILCLLLCMFGMALILETRKFGDRNKTLLLVILSFGISAKILKKQVPLAFVYIFTRIAIYMYSGKISSLMISTTEEVTLIN